MTSGQDVSEFLDTLGLVKSDFSSFFEHQKKFFFIFFGAKKNKNKIHPQKDFFFCDAPTPQRIRRFACLKDCFLTLTCHLAAVLRINLNIDGTPITSRTHTHPSHSPTSRLLTSSLSLGVPVPRTTECM